MSLKVTQAQYDRWQVHLERAGNISKAKIGPQNPRKITKEREEEILREYSNNKGSSYATVKSAKCGSNTLKAVLRARGLN